SCPGPDICGPGTKKVHVIFNYKGKNVLINKDIRCKDDEFTHLYTLVVRPDNTYEVKIDNARVESGSLEEDWDFLPPKKIKDPEARKPDDWDERAKIDDPEDTKPEGTTRPLSNSVLVSSGWSISICPSWRGCGTPIDSPSPQVRSGTIFDNFLITDDEKLAEEIGNETWGATKVRPL
ncbi:CALR protein, partial [Tachuris rubrigastra]|nr:CALR protein [Tachuris rubrigastra]